MNDKFSLEEIKQMLLEPSFDLEAQDYNHSWTPKAMEYFFETIEEAIKHHEKLNKSNNGEGVH